ncbi:MAG: hypothetical protein JHD02_03310 [Thermoleophilaceae bacterium]|nr:hypothetical protein [Thermoleophilaceae bacterium]
MEHSSSSKRASRAFIRLVSLLAVAIVAFSAAGCEKESKPAEAKNEGIRVYVDGAYYQVQISRMLNPKDVEDSFYLEGQPAPAKGDAYFGVFMYVTNEDSDRRILPIGTEEMKIVTAAGEEFEPLEVEAPGWGYAPSPIGRGAMLPVANTPAFVGPIRGGLVLFRMSQASLEARPLELELESRDGKDKAQITLDV